MRSDGEIVISTSLDNKNLNNDIKEIQNQLEKFRKKAEAPYEIDGVEVTGGWNLTEEEQKQYDELLGKLEQLEAEKYELKEAEQQINNEINKNNAATQQQTNLIEQQKQSNTENADKIYKMSAELENMVKEYNSIKKADIISNEDLTQAEELKTDIISLSKELEKLTGQKITIKGINDVSPQLQKIDLGIGGIIKKVARWGLAIFSIRSAYMFVRQAVSTLSQYNEGLATDIEYIRYVLANALKPVIEGIINLVKTLLVYIGYIAKAWFGVDLWANSSAKNFKKAKDNVSGVSKEAKKLEKQLTGFDEMNILQEDGSTSKGGGGGGTPLPSFDLVAPEDVPVPSWLKWIADNKDLIVSAFGGIIAGLAGMKAGLAPLQALGAGLGVAGLLYAFQGLIAYLKDPSWENFGKIITGIGVAVAGVAIAIGNWPLAVAGAIIAIIGIIVSNWEEIKSFFQNGIDWLSGKSDWVHDMFGDTIGGIYDFIVRTLQRILDYFDLTFTSIKKVFDGVIDFITGVFTGDWSKAWDGIKNIFGGIWDWISGTAKLVLEGLIDKAKTIVSTVGNVIASVFKAAVNGVLSAIESILNAPIKAVNGLIGVINKVPGINLGKLKTFNLPRLAKGGIISQPGRGVPVGYGQAIGGEHGREGVIPLTDAQQMALLGEAIGKYININLTNITKLDNRQIAREQKIINAQNDFTFNR